MTESVRATTYEWHSVVRGHHVYKEVWTPVIGEELTVKKEKDNGYDRYAVSIIMNADTDRNCVSS